MSRCVDDVLHVGIKEDVGDEDIVVVALPTNPIAVAVVVIVVVVVVVVVVAVVKDVAVVGGCRASEATQNP